MNRRDFMERLSALAALPLLPKLPALPPEKLPIDPALLIHRPVYRPDASHFVEPLAAMRCNDGWEWMEWVIVRAEANVLVTGLRFTSPVHFVREAKIELYYHVGDSRELLEQRIVTSCQSAMNYFDARPSWIDIVRNVFWVDNTARSWAPVVRS